MPGYARPTTVVLSTEVVTQPTGDISATDLQGAITEIATEKAPLISPNFTGTVVLPSTTSIGNITSTELGYVDGVTSGIQTQINLKSNINSPTFTGIPSAPTASVDTNTTQLSTTSYVINQGYLKSSSAQTTYSPLNVLTNAQTTSYTLVIGDAAKIVEISSTGATTLTVPLNSSVAFPVGASITILQTNTGQITVAGTGGVTVNATPGLKLRAQWSSATLIKRGTDLWVLVGDLSV